MAWRLVNSLKKLRAQIDAAYPNHSKTSDGAIGDSAHQARTSDHNQEPDGTVDAIDITHDPKNGFDAGALAETLRANKDPRIKYVIWNKRIFSSTTKPWVWRPASGHTQHIHISVNDHNQDNASPWHIERGTVVVPPPAAKEPLLSIGARGDAVKQLQAILKIESDGIFGPQTLAAVRAFQAANKLYVDGIVGPFTWEKLDP